MSLSRVASSNILNRSPFIVTVRSDPTLSRRFSAAEKNKALAYSESLVARGIKSRLTQLETSFQFRVRKKGLRQQFITFDTFEQAEQARLQIDANLSVSIVRDYAAAATTTLRDLLERYLKEIVPSHKGADVEAAYTRRLLD